MTFRCVIPAELSRSRAELRIVVAEQFRGAGVGSLIWKALCQHPETVKQQIYAVIGAFSSTTSADLICRIAPLIGANPIAEAFLRKSGFRKAVT